MTNFYIFDLFFIYSPPTPAPQPPTPHPAPGPHGNFATNFEGSTGTNLKFSGESDGDVSKGPVEFEFDLR